MHVCLMCELQRRVTEAEEEIQQQRREMEAGFLVQTQQLEAKYKQKTSTAIQASLSCFGAGPPESFFIGMYNGFLTVVVCSVYH